MPYVYILYFIYYRYCECERDSDLCGDRLYILGGGFYSCDCKRVTQVTTCVGRYFNSYSYHSTHKLSILALIR